MKISPSAIGSEDLILYREWEKACFFAWIVFVSYEAMIYLDRRYSPHPLCSNSLKDYGYFYTFSHVSFLSGFGFTWIILIAKILRSRSGNERVPNFIAFNVASISFLTAILDATTLEWGGICIDALGVATPASLWGEWISCGPLLIFFTVSMVGKDKLNRMDLTIMITFFLTIIFGFITIIPQPTFFGYFWFLLSSVSFLPTLYLPLHVSQPHHQESMDLEVGLKHRSIRGEQRFHFAVWLTIAFPLFPLVYLLAALNVIGPGDTIGLFLLLSVIAKGFLLIVIMDEFTNVLLEVQQALSKEQIANHMRRAFLKYIFHEVRTPLNSMVMGLEILRRREYLDPIDTDLLTMMYSATDFMSETLNNVLSLQKMEEGKVQLEMGSFSIADSIGKVSSTLAGAQVAKNLHLESTVDASVPDRLLGDRYRVEHVISNLLSNATKFSPEGGTIRIHVSAERTAVETTMAVTVSITDEGPGISGEDQKKLFENFFQVRPNQLQQGQGSGLGLSLCKQIVSLHGGTIGLDSREGGGSTFFFTIPFQVVVAEEEQEEEEDIIHEHADITIRNKSAAHSFAEVPHLNPASRILVVDDISSNRKMLKMLLSGTGAVIDLAENGQEAVTKVLDTISGGYDIVFMDNLMPVMDGLEATKLLREGGYKNLVVGVTGNVLDDDVNEFQAAGADIILGKPVRLNVLTTILRHVVQEGCLSRPGMTLVADRDALVWRLRDSVEHKK